jgi:predicted enzyme related to lactoylglutathione lyase
VAVSSRAERAFSPPVGIGLRVADVHAAVEEVRAAGGELMGIADSGVCHMGYIKDPDGNVVILHRRYAQRSKAT